MSCLCTAGTTTSACDDMDLCAVLGPCLGIRCLAVQKNIVSVPQQKPRHHLSQWHELGHRSWWTPGGTEDGIMWLKLRNQDGRYHIEWVSAMYTHCGNGGNRS